ncbi:MAG: zinc-binding alcohol dehydrogenase family protein [Caulobacteraceae bacterium]|nr:zinc-binding alcohol dehydrogenase family protein [Caulobacteraceae bacterium]
MPRLRVYEKAGDIGALKLALEPWDPPKPHPGEVVVEIRAAGVNPSDVKAMLGAMPHAVWPRTPGRDWAGVVTEGPPELKGRAVWGTGGELGVRRDGSHASHLVLEATKVRLKPEPISLREAGAVGVPFITAYEGLRRAGLPKAEDTVLVLGANGKVGQAAIQIATMLGARVFGVERNSGTYAGHASGPVRTIDAGKEDLAKVVREVTDGHGADIVYNTVGSPYFEQANAAMALRGRQIFISTIDRSVPFDIMDFYRGQRTFVGVDTLALDGAACAEILDALTPGFESGALRPFPVLDDAVYPLERAKEAYQAVLSGSQDRVILAP